VSTWAERRAEILGGSAGDEDGCKGNWEGDGERDAARRLGRVVRRMSGRMTLSMSGRMTLSMSGRMAFSMSGRKLLRLLVMVSCHTSVTTVALDEVVERAPCDDGVARSVGETERVRCSRSTHFGRGESGVRLLRAACGV
jgi:hypothetical protein